MGERTTPTTRCRSCGADIWWGTSPKGRLAPYNIDPKTGVALGVNHFETCPDAHRWSRTPSGGARHGGRLRGAAP